LPSNLSSFAPILSDNVSQPRLLSDMYTLHTTELSNIITEITLIWQQLYKNVPQEKRKHVKKMTNLLALADRILVDQLPTIADSISNQEQHIDKLRNELKSRRPVLYSPGRWKFIQKSWVRQGLSTDSHIVRVINIGEVFEVAQVIEYNGRVRAQVEEGFITLHSLERNIAFVTRDSQDMALKQEEERIPDVIFVTGRIGFNSAMNGAYQRGSSLHDGFPYFKNKENGWVLRYFRGRWMFDWRGCESDDISAAVLRTDAPHPGMGDQAWKVFDGRRWVKDPNIQCKGMSLPKAPNKSEKKRTPQKSRKRQPSKIGAFFSSFLGSSKRDPKVKTKPGDVLIIEGAPKTIIVAGRSGYNSAINGIYTRGGHLHHGKVFYHRESVKGMGVWYIRWRPVREMWLIDLRDNGLPTSDEGHCQAFCQQDCANPVLTTMAWKVWNENGKFVADLNVSISREFDEDSVAEPSFALPEPGLTRKRNPGTHRKRPSVPSINLNAQKAASAKRHARTVSTGVRSRARAQSVSPLARVQRPGRVTRQKSMIALPSNFSRTRHARSMSAAPRNLKPQLSRFKSMTALGEDDDDEYTGRREAVTTPSNLVRLEDAELWGGAALEKQEQEMLEELAKLKVAPLAKMKSAEDLLIHAKAIENDLLQERDQKLEIILAKEEARNKNRKRENSMSEDSVIESESVGDLEFEEKAKRNVERNVEREESMSADSQMTDMSDPLDDLSDAEKPAEPTVEPAREPEPQMSPRKKRGPGKREPGEGAPLPMPDEDKKRAPITQCREEDDDPDPDLGADADPERDAREMQQAMENMKRENEKAMESMKREKQENTLIE